MAISIIALIVGLILLVWSADHFVEGAVSVARYFGMSPLLIGIVVIGFGTSTPEMIVSMLASLQGNAGVALGNAYGSNITNIALIIGLTALISPLKVHSKVIIRELPVLLAVTLFAWWQLRDGSMSRIDATGLIIVFLGIMIWIVKSSASEPDEKHSIVDEVGPSEQTVVRPIRHGVFRLVLGLLVLIVSSRLLVWSAVKLAQSFGVSDLVIGLTVIAVGTSLPELASSVMAARKGEHDMALGNVIGSNLFNTMFVIGMAGLVKPLSVDPNVLTRDMPVMAGLTALLFLFSYGFKKQATISRLKGCIFLAAYGVYTASLLI